MAASDADARRDARRRALIERFPGAAVVMFDRDLRCCVAEGAALAQLGLSRELVEGRSLREVCPRGVWDQLEPRFRAALAGAEVVVELEHAGATYEITVAPLRDEHDSVGAGVALAQDVTERARLRARLRDAEDRYRRLVEQLPAMTYTVPYGEDNAPVYTSPHCEQLLGYTPAEWAREPDPWLRFMHRDDHARVADELARRRATGDVSLEYRFIAKDGRVIWVRDRLVLARDAAGAPLYWQGVAFDITESKETEAALRASDDRFRGAFDHAGIGMALSGLDERFMRVNPAMCRFIGYSAEELERLTIEDISHPDDYGANADQIALLLSGARQKVEFEKRYRHRDGRVLWGSVSASLVRDAAGAPLYLISQVQDITDRKRATEELRRSEREFKTLADNAPDAIVRYDRDCRYLYANPMAVRLLARDGQGLIGRTVGETTGKPERQAFWQGIVDGIVAGGRPADVAYTAATNAGERAFEARVVPEFDADGVVRSVLAVARDVTEAARAAEALRASEERYRSAFQDAAVGMALYDFSGRVVRVNAALCRMLGADEPALVGRAFESILHPDDPPIRSQDLTEVLAGDTLTYQTERRLLRADGETVHATLSVSVVRDDGGGPQFLVAQAQDVTARTLAEEALRESEERFRSAFDDAGIGMSISGVDGRWERVNRPMARMLGCTEVELLQGAFWDVTHPDDLPSQRANVDRLLRGEANAFEMEKRYIRKDGEVVHAALNVSVIHDTAGQALRLVAQAQDITARKRAEEALRESEQRFRSVFESPALGIAINALDGTWLQVNRALCELVGYSEAELLATTFQAITDPDDLDENLDNVRRLVAGEISSYQMEKRYLHKQGCVVWAQLNVALVRDAADRPAYFVAQIHDISERKKIEERLRQQARYDALTGLPNRAFYMERLEHALARAQRSGALFGVMFIDLDGFKAVNDTLGHAAGDELLVEVAARLQGCLRAGDTVARLGGDEFTALLDGMAGPQVAAIVARRMIEAIGRPFDLAGQPAHVGVSIGISWGGPATVDAARLLQEADTALYEAKARGKRQFAMFDELRAELERVAPAHLAPARATPRASRRDS